MDIDLFAKLEGYGWQWVDDALVAPNGTMWFAKDISWPRGLRGLRDDMTSRLRRIELSREQSPHDADQAAADVHQVLRVLDEIIGP